MQRIYTLLSDYKLENELMDGLISRNLDQKFWYLEECANLYYDIVDIDTKVFSDKAMDQTDIKNFGMKNCFNENKKNIFISLGCGCSFLEKQLIEELSKSDKFDTTYVGVDSSKKMISLAEDAISNIDIKKHFICGDFGSDDFKEFLNNYFAHDNEEKVFGFLGNTFGNIDHNNIMNILFNLLRPGEKIWISVCLSSGGETKDDYNDYQIYKNWFQLPETQKYIELTLKKYGLDPSHGTASFEVSKVPFLNASIYQFTFILKERKAVELMGKEILFLPNEKIKLFKIYSYDSQGLINFFKEYGFELINFQNKGFEGQFLFQKV